MSHKRIGIVIVIFVAEPRGGFIPVGSGSRIVKDATVDPIVGGLQEEIISVV